VRLVGWLLAMGLGRHIRGLGTLNEFRLQNPGLGKTSLNPAHEGVFTEAVQDIFVSSDGVSTARLPTEIWLRGLDYRDSKRSKDRGLAVCQHNIHGRRGLRL